RGARLVSHAGLGAELVADGPLEALDVGGLAGVLGLEQSAAVGTLAAAQDLDAGGTVPGPADRRDAGIGAAGRVHRRALGVVAVPIAGLTVTVAGLTVAVAGLTVTVAGLAITIAGLAITIAGVAVAVAVARGLGPAGLVVRWLATAARQQHGTDQGQRPGQGVASHVDITPQIAPPRYCQRTEATRLPPGSSRSPKRCWPVAVLITSVADSGSSLFDSGRVTSTNTVPLTWRMVMISTRSAP